MADIPSNTDVDVQQEDSPISNDVIVPGPEKCMHEYSCFAENEKYMTKTLLKSFQNEKDMKKVIKEGGKKGVEVEGAADMGGLQFFCCRMDDQLTKGNVYHLVETMKAMNAVSNPDEEERKGDSGKVGKMIFSTAPDESRWSAVAYIPTYIANGGEENQDKTAISAKEWLSHVVKESVGKESYEKYVVFTDESGKEDSLVQDFEKYESELGCKISNKNWAFVQINADQEKNFFPIKIRDPSISYAYNYLKERDLFNMEDSDDDSEIYGEDLEW